MSIEKKFISVSIGKSSGRESANRFFGDIQSNLSGMERHYHVKDFFESLHSLS